MIYRKQSQQVIVSLIFFSPVGVIGKNDFNQKVNGAGLVDAACSLGRIQENLENQNSTILSVGVRVSPEKAGTLDYVTRGW